MSAPDRFQPHPPDLPTKQPGEPPGLLDDPRYALWGKRVAIAIVLVMFVMDFFIHYHEYIGLENIPGFYTLFGYVASVILIFVSKGLGSGLKRQEDYYDE